MGRQGADAGSARPYARGVAQRRHHYERAFEAYLRLRRHPYIAVDEARKALLPPGAKLAVVDRAARSGVGEGEAAAAGVATALKSFDFVLYGPALNWLVDVKGRKASAAALAGFADGRASGGRRLECWVTREDIDSLRTWEGLFGAGFQAAFVFVYWCESQPPDGLFQEILEYQGRWYAIRAVTVEAYRSAARTRSPRWGTVDVRAADFERLSRPFDSAWPAGDVERAATGWNPGLVRLEPLEGDSGPTEAGGA